MSEKRLSRARGDASPGERPLFTESIGKRLRVALDEDLGRGDITSEALIPATATAGAAIMARQSGVLCGLPLAPMLLGLVDERLQFEASSADGVRVERGDVLGTIRGPLRGILAAERTMLNLLQRASGIATLTAQYVAACEGTGAVIVDTRKTTPGWRDLEKYAVRIGGGRNHRMGLDDAVLIKDNHLDGGGLTAAEAVRRARQAAGDPAFIEVEVRTLDDLRAVLPAEPDIVMPDNFPVEQLREAVKIVKDHRGDRDRPLIEASGGVTLETVRSIALTGVDRIAVGALTHSAPALDIALDVVPKRG